MINHSVSPAVATQLSVVLIGFAMLIFAISAMAQSLHR